MRLGADIGGTFTDVILYDEQSGLFQLGKVLTTPDQPEVRFGRITGHSDFIGNRPLSAKKRHTPILNNRSIVTHHDAGGGAVHTRSADYMIGFPNSSVNVSSVLSTVR